MSSLSSALNYALAGLSTSAAQSALVSRNVSNAGQENYTRRTADVFTMPGGAPSVVGYTRSTDKQLLEKLLGSTSNSLSKQVALDSLTRLSGVLGAGDDGTTLGEKIATLQQALKTYETDPGNDTLASRVVTTAGVVTSALNTASEEIHAVRRDADQAMSESVDRVNSLLTQFKVVNDTIVRGQGSPADLNDALDQRDGILKQLSEEIGISTMSRSNNDLVIFASGGAVLFEGAPRTVSFMPSHPLNAGMDGNAVYVDGVAVTGSGSPMPVTSGKLAAYQDIRDRVAVQAQIQIDELAGGLIRNFAEHDPGDPPSLPDVEGLLYDSLGGGLPGTPAPAGLAARIALNPLADPSKGGDLHLIRDGGFGGPAYVSNTTGASGNQFRLTQVIAAMGSPSDFDLSAGLGSQVSVIDFASRIAGWIEGSRQKAQSESEGASAAQARTNESLQRVTGVSIDQEMAQLLDLEKSYQASSKIVSVIDSMLSSLFEAVR